LRSPSKLTLFSTVDGFHNLPLDLRKHIKAFSLYDKERNLKHHTDKKNHIIEQIILLKKTGLFPKPIKRACSL
jgi:hypothetical protein